jgi:hypothetical protein
MIAAWTGPKTKWAGWSSILQTGTEKSELTPTTLTDACKPVKQIGGRSGAMMARVVLSPALNVLRSYGENRPMKTAPCRSDVHAARTHLQRVIFSKKISRSGYS